MEYDTAKNTIEGWMNDTDLLWLFDAAKEMENVVEIGSWKGRSTHALLSGCKGTVYAVDHFLGSSNEPEAHAEAKARDISQDFMKNVGSFKNLKVLKMGSADAVKQFEDNSVDMVFIDAGHTYEEVLNDIKLWLPKTKKIICGHDRRHPPVKKALRKMFGEEWKGNDGRRSNIWIKNIKTRRHSELDSESTAGGSNVDSRLRGNDEIKNTIDLSHNKKYGNIEVLLLYVFS